MKNLFKILILTLFTFSFSQDCIDGIEVELWDECYHIDTTFIIDLPNSGLTGEIPSQIGQLINLSYLNLFENNLSGQIPIEIGDLVNLTHLELDHNNLSGQIPIEIGDLINLRHLGLYNNQLSGEIPAEISNLSYLMTLDLSNNNLVGQIPSSIGNLVNLNYLVLYRNQLTHEIPLSITNLTNLIYLSLWDNQLTGEIPSNIGNLINLERLDLDRNDLSGEIPSSIWNLTNLNILFLFENQLSGEIPSEIGNLTNLNTLAIGNNQFTGLIPEEICDININPIFDNYDLTQEIFNDNNFCPPYPECIQDYINIEYQDITNCFSCGDDDVYDLWGTCYHSVYTTDLNLSNSGLTGEIPQEIENFVNLTYLSLRDNNLSGLVGNFICDIETYSLVNNFFCGPFPDCIDSDSVFPQENSYDCEEYCNNNTQVNLWDVCYGIDETTQITLSNSGLIGEIPPGIGNLINLERLYLNGNQLTGEIPPEIGNLVNLERLYLHENQLTGEIPLEISNLISLNRLYLVENQLTGTIPSEIGDLLILEKLYLNENQLTGIIPVEIGNLTNLTSLYLSDNFLLGEIPNSICNQGDSSPSLENNNLCPPYPDCLSEDDIGEQDTSGCEELSNSDIHPFEYSLNKPYPNPFNPSTMISFSVPSFDKVYINVYDLKGSLVTQLVSDYYHPGNHAINWDGSDYPSGNYIVKMKSNNYESSQILTLLK